MKTSILLALALLLAAPGLAQNALESLAPSPGRSGSLGLGYGIPYGGKLGVNADVYFFDAAALTAGIGSYGYTAGYAVGAKYFHGSPQKFWRPQALLVYGINRVLVVQDSVAGDTHEPFSGFTLGLGSQFMFGQARRHGFDVDLLYVVSSGIYRRLEDLEQQGYSVPSVGRFSFSVGYRYAFDLKF